MASITGPGGGFARRRVARDRHREDVADAVAVAVGLHPVARLGGDDADLEPMVVEGGQRCDGVLERAASDWCRQVRHVVGRDQRSTTAGSSESDRTTPARASQDRATPRRSRGTPADHLGGGVAVGREDGLLGVDEVPSESKRTPLIMVAPVSSRCWRRRPVARTPRRSGRAGSGGRRTLPGRAAVGDEVGDLLHLAVVAERALHGELLLHDPPGFAANGSTESATRDSRLRAQGLHGGGERRGDAGALDGRVGRAPSP